ncbi:hypothetical protein A9Q78_06015 [Methylophaga sp. 41_12_T18]|nr:hypothetical protein A9Q78_06015 [Methylophaga sp. 41_12_T18]
MLFFISDGRLGNQSFQYAFLNTRAKTSEKVLCINMTQFSKYFNIGNPHFTFLTTTRITSFIYRKLISKILTILVRFKVIGCIKQLRGDDGKPIPEVSEVKGFIPFTYVKTGFFQSEKLFENAKVDFCLKGEHVKVAKNILQLLPQKEKVFIHVRRGDYISEIYQGERGIELPKQYFLDAMKLVEGKVRNPFYIFLTDDPSYVRDCFSEIKNKYISKENLATDLAIMSLCDYGVVSNSSFSWWGAFLSVDKKLMIFPKYWYGWKKRAESHPCIQPVWGATIDVRQL